MNRLTAIGLASLVAYGLLLTTKYMGVVSAAREDAGSISALREGRIVGSAVIGAPSEEPVAKRVVLPLPVPRTEPMRASVTALDFRAARDLKAFADGLSSRRASLSGDERYHLAKALEECQFTTTVNEDLAAYSAKQRRQFLAGLTAGDANNPRRIAAYDAVDNTQRCMRFQGAKISQKEIEDLYLSAAQQGDARAQARILVAELTVKSRSVAADTPVGSRIGDQMAQMIALLESGDPESMMIVGGFLSQSAVASSLHIGPNGEIPEPSAFLGAFSLVACDLGPDCVQLSREPQMACAYGGYCDSGSFEELYYNFMATPYTYMQAVRYRNLIMTAINTRNWSLIGLTPPVASSTAPPQ
ncbi:MAG: hypothetical protein H7Y14_11515 [Burkholderiales bacterium]|nr:hypothetical protein [Burkholderiales bacterium]